MNYVRCKSVVVLLLVIGFSTPSAGAVRWLKSRSRGQLATAAVTVAVIAGVAACAWSRSQQEHCLRRPAPLVVPMCEPMSTLQECLKFEVDRGRTPVPRSSLPVDTVNPKTFIDWLHKYVQEGNADGLEYMFDRGSPDFCQNLSLEGQDGCGQTPLQSAARRLAFAGSCGENCLKIVNLLVKNGASVHPYDGRDPLAIVAAGIENEAEHIRLRRLKAWDVSERMQRIVWLQAAATSLLKARACTTVPYVVHDDQRCPVQQVEGHSIFHCGRATPSSVARVVSDRSSSLNPHLHDIFVEHETFDKEIAAEVYGNASTR